MEKSLPSIPEALYAKTMGSVLLEYAKGYDPSMLSARLDCAAWEALEKIRAALDDKSLTDPECFLRVEAVVHAFFDAGLSTTRHMEIE